MKIYFLSLSVNLLSSFSNVEKFYQFVTKESMAYLFKSQPREVCLPTDVQNIGLRSWQVWALPRKYYYMHA